MRVLIILLLLLTVSASAQTYFAEHDPNTNIVLRVVVADQAFINSGALGAPSRFTQTCIPPAPCPNSFTHYAGIGYTYDAVHKTYIAPRPFPSWILDANFIWQPPVPYPNDGKSYVWDEASQSWKPV